MGTTAVHTGTRVKFAARRKLHLLCQPGCWKTGFSKPFERAGHKAEGPKAGSPWREGAMAAQPPDPLRPKKQRKEEVLMRIMRKLLSVAVALSLCASLAAPAFAVVEYDISEGSVHVENNDDGGTVSWQDDHEE